MSEQAKDTPTEVSEEEIYRLVRKEVELRRQQVETRLFYIHLAVFTAVNLGLIIIWRVTGAGFPWFAFPLGIWGIFISVHLFMASVLAGRAPYARDRVRAVTEKEVEKLKEEGLTVEEMERLREADTLNKGGN